MADLGELREIFFVEADELLVALEEGLRALQTGDAPSDTVNAVFRAVHSIKGGAGAFALNALVGFAHRFETVLDRLRAGELAADPGLIQSLLQASDHLADIVAANRHGDCTDPQLDERIIAALEAQAGPAEAGHEADFSFDALPLAFDLASDLGPESTMRDLIIHFCPHGDVYTGGHDPSLILRDICEMGAAEVCLLPRLIPAVGDFDPGHSFLAWEIRLRTEWPLVNVQMVFEFIEGACELTIAEVEPLPQADLQCDMTTAVLSQEPPSQASAGREFSSAALNTQVPQTRTNVPRQTIRVDIERVDRLVDILGELVIHQAMLTEAIEQSPGFGSVEVDRSLDQLRQLSRQIQDSVMAIRAQPVKPLFDRMHRILREAATAAGKSARLVTEGEATEVDKTIIERLADPLTHMIRNAVDHGLEVTEHRTRAGKAPEGEVRLSAAHRSGRIVITVQDDGAGIDRDRVRQIAIDRGLISATAELSPQEIDGLLFLPGFSTASEVSSLSGRGVGMDVVRSEIASLGGRVSIASQRGQGTVLTISLPLTLAVLDGMVFDAAGQTLVLPVSSIIETLRPDMVIRHHLVQADTVIEVRGRCLPLIDVGAALGFRPVLKEGEGEIVVVVERGDEGAIALMVDGIKDQRQVVIKGLDANYGQIPGIAAATVLGDGSVALILDPGDLAGSTYRQIATIAAE